MKSWKAEELRRVFVVEQKEELQKSPKNRTTKMGAKQLEQDHCWEEKK
jgi:hypothetical protein